MHITYDPEADAMAIILCKGTVEETLIVTDNVNVDVDKEGRPLCIEILSVHEQLGSDTTRRFSFEVLSPNNE